MGQRRFLVLLSHVGLLRLALLVNGANGMQEQELTNFNHLNSLDFSASSLVRDNQSSTVETEVPINSPESSKSHQKTRARALEPNKLLSDLPGLIESLLRELGSGKNKQARSESVASSNSSRSRGKSWSPVGGETSNLMSVTNQLVKLARSQTSSDLSSWLTPMASWAHEIPAEFGGISAKSDWFWMVVPAVIVLGAGVILIPMATAWLVSHAMSQSALSVTAAGKRRRKRDLLGSLQDGAPYMEQLYKMLDLHRLLDDPAVLMDKLSRFHSALDSVQASMISSSRVKVPSKKQ